LATWRGLLFGIFTLAKKKNIPSVKVLGYSPTNCADESRNQICDNQRNLRAKYQRYLAITLDGYDNVNLKEKGFELVLSEA